MSVSFPREMICGQIRQDLELLFDSESRFTRCPRSVLKMRSLVGWVPRVIGAGRVPEDRVSRLTKPITDE